MRRQCAYRRIEDSRGAEFRLLSSCQNRLPDVNEFGVPGRLRRPSAAPDFYCIARVAVPQTSRTS
jgi:hypothetical protein